MANGIGTTESQFFSITEATTLQHGGVLPGITLAYEMYGEMNAKRDNVILLFHALTGSQHAAGVCENVPGLSVEWTPECQQGWWDGFVGPDLALDTNRFCVICVNYLGGCYGTTGPASSNPETGKPYGNSFPRVSAADIVDSQVRLLDHLGVDVLHATVGASLGGMLCTCLATRHPNRVARVMAIASGLSTSPLQRLLNFEQICAIENDANFKGGDYYEGKRPNKGMALARMICHKTFLSLDTMKERARMEIRHDQEGAFEWYEVSRALESYMHYQGAKFVRRFDANTYLRLMDAWQHFNLFKDADVTTTEALFKVCQKQSFLLFTIDSDVCFYPSQQTMLQNALKKADVPTMRITVHSEKGHDSFLLEPELYTPHLAYALNDGGTPG
jgi:homoserine O-acetyltransferase